MEKRTYHSSGRPVEVCVLENGLTVACNQTEFPFVKMELLFAVGSYHDPIPGMAHFAEHLIAGGPNGEGVHPIMKPLILNGAHRNCVTSYAYTAYEIGCLPDDAATALRALFQMCSESKFGEDRIARERGIICEEIRGKKDVSQRYVWDAERRFPGISGLHPVLGTSASITDINEENARAFLRTSYVTDNALLSVTSPYALDDVVHIVQSIPADVFRRGVPNARGLRFTPRVINDTYLAPRRTSRVWFYVPEPEDTDDEARLHLLFDALTAFPFGALYQRLRTQDGEVYSIGRKDSSPPMCDLGVRIDGPGDRLESYVERFHEEIAYIRAGKISDEAFALALGERRMFFATRPLMAIGRAADWFRMDWIAGNTDDIDRRELFLSTTKTHLIELANKYLRPEQIGCIRFRRSDE